jgi:hypothetical protein
MGDSHDIKGHVQTLLNFVEPKATGIHVVAIRHGALGSYLECDRNRIAFGRFSLK